MFRPLHAVIVAACLAVVAVSAQNTTGRGQSRRGDWITYGADLAGTKHTELTEITAANVATLTQAWTVQLTTPPGGRRGAGAASPAGGAPRQGGPGANGAAVDPSGVAPLGSNPQATPIAVDGIVYLPAAGNSVLALDGETGKEVWTFTLPARTATTARGVAYWAGERNLAPRIFLTAFKKPGLNYGRGTDGSKQTHDRASIGGPGPYASFMAPMRLADGRTANLPCTRPPWAQLIAVNANTGDILWKTPLGLNEDLPAGRQHVGGSGSAGPMTTASGLVFIGATNDRRFRAFDAKTGTELWATRLAQAVNANPMSYQGKNGKQYVAVVANSQLVAFTLP